MRSFFDRAAAGTVKDSSTSLSDSGNQQLSSKICEATSSSTTTRVSLLPGLVVSAFSVFERSGGELSSREKKAPGPWRTNGWSAALRRFVGSGSMWRFKEQVFGFNRCNATSSTEDIWLLGVCYKVVPEEDSGNGDPVSTSGFAAFVEDFSSRILITYRKGFDPIVDTKYTSDVHWGCMLRSSQMLVAQALVVHQLGRSWRRSTSKQHDQAYIEILRQFSDSEKGAFSIHNILQAGKTYGLAAGSWVGPYAMCRTWEILARSLREAKESLPMAVYIVSGDEDGERGGAPTVCIEDVSRQCSEYSDGKNDWTPILLLVPLVLGLDKLNPRYLPLLRGTYMFPQSLGILGGKPGASTYVVGVQDDKAFYLDPHENQQVVIFDENDVEVDTTSYHCNVVHNLPLDSIDPSLAIGFYCRDKDDFDDFCLRASKLAEESGGAPLFTVTHCRSSPKASNQLDKATTDFNESQVDDSYDMASSANEESAQEDDWQLL
ncbi:Cysteine protease ATG4-like protein [Drosera capensis]